MESEYDFSKGVRGKYVKVCVCGHTLQDHEEELLKMPCSVDECSCTRFKTEGKEYLEVYSSGLFYCSVCTDITDREEILKVLNAKHPCGTDNGWIHSTDTHFVQGAPNPCPCDDHEDRMHYLMDA